MGVGAVTLWAFAEAAHEAVMSQVRVGRDVTALAMSPRYARRVQAHVPGAKVFGLPVLQDINVAYGDVLAVTAQSFPVTALEREVVEAAYHARR